MKQNRLLSLILILISGIILGIYAFPFYLYKIDVPYINNPYKLGLDLQGGIELDYKVDLEEVRKDPKNTRQAEKAIIEGLKSIIDKRIESLKINDSQINGASYGNEEHIIVQIPLKGTSTDQDKANIAKAKEAIGKVVKIEFKEERTAISENDIKARKDIADKLLSESIASKYAFEVGTSQFKDSYENVSVGTFTITEKESNKYFNTGSIDLASLHLGVVNKVVPGKNTTSLLGSDGKLNLNGKEEKGYWILHLKEKKETAYTFDYAFVSASPSEWKPAQDSKGRILNDTYFSKSSVQYNQAYQPMVELVFNSQGAEIFGELTQRLTGKPIAIFVGGQLLTAPRVNEPILTGKAVITGNYTPEEASKLAQDINTGVVPAPIYLTSEKSIDSKLGLNSLQELIIAGFFGYLAIVLFLIIVYRASGVAASVTLLLYIVILLAIVKSFGIVLTLASIAGLILSLGMAIDANVLIFERIKDELREKKTMDVALKNGFEQSFSAIWDGHISGLLVAIVLFIFGINLIKGFGLMLIIGTVVSLFVFYNISRVFSMVLGKSKLSHKAFIGQKD